MGRRFRSNDITSAAWRIRMSTEPIPPQRYLDNRPEPPAPPPQAPAVRASPPPADPLRSLFETLRKQTASALPRLGAHERTQVGDLAARLEGLMAGHARGLDTSTTLPSLRQRAEHLARHAGDTAAARPSTRAEHVLAALQALKLSVGMHELFVRLARTTTRWRDAMADPQALALLERDEARPLAAEVLAFLRAAHETTVHSVWQFGAPPSPDANALFFSGCQGPVAEALQVAARAVGLRVEPADRAGAEGLAERWYSLLRSHVAVFDLSDAAPHVYYELGMALVAGNALVLLAPSGLVLPFDVAQNVTRYAQAGELASLLPAALDSAAYGVQVQGPRHPERLSFEIRGRATVVRPRWMPVPQDRTPRWFAVMPFREGPFARWNTLRKRLARLHPSVRPVRGDIAEGEHIIASIWDELCRATHVTVDLSGLNLNVCLEAGIAHALGRPTLFIGERGTAMRLNLALPELARWRCHEYAPDSSKAFNAAIDRFFGVS